MTRSIRILAFAAAVLCVAAPARATFHIMSISELMVGIGGDPDAQYVELRLDLALQNLVHNTRLAAFNADGTAMNIVTLSSHDVAQSQANRRFLYATSALTTLTGITPDFTIPNGMIFTPSGMVCWGAPSQISVPPPTWDATNPNNYIDCIAYGNYTGPTRNGAPTVGTSGTPSALPPGDGTLALTRITGVGQSVGGNNATDFALRPPGPCLNTAGSCQQPGCVNPNGVCGLAGCGNGNLDPGESCDDGNLVSGDGCDANCDFTPTPQQIACKRGIVKAASKFGQAYTKALSGCDAQVLAGKIMGPCPDMKTSDKIAKAEANKISAIAKACSVVSAVGAGYGTNCPGIDATCGAAIGSIHDVSTCVDCVHEQAGGSFETTLFGGFAGGNPVAEKCQAAIGKSFNKAYAASLKALAKCEDKALLGKIPGPCPDADTTGSIGVVVGKAAQALCKACGGADKACGGGDDVTLADIGITTCPAVNDGAVDCSTIPMTTTTNLNTCLACVTHSRTGCAHAVGAHPKQMPASCDPVPTPTMTPLPTVTPTP